MGEGRDIETAGMQGGRPSPRPSPIRMLRDRARTFLQEHLDLLFERVDDTFFDLADRALNQNEQTLYFDAMRMMRLNRRRVESEFIAGITEAFDSLGSTMEEQRQPEPSELQILDNDELEEMIAFDNMVSRATLKCRPALDHLNARGGHLLGTTLEEKGNPFFPELVGECFARQLRALDLKLRPKLVMLKLFERYVLADWFNYVETSNQLLRDMAILPDLENQAGKTEDKPEPPPRVREQQTPYSTADNSGKERGSGADPDVRDKTAGRRRRQGETPRERVYGELVMELHKVLGGGAGGGGRDDSGAVGEQGVIDHGDLMDAITDLQTGADMEVVLDTLAERGLENFLERELAESGKSIAALGEVDRSIIRLLDRLFRRVGEKELAPRELDRLMLRLQLPVLRIALHDPDFLEQPKHPGRRLISEIVRASNGFMDEENRENDPLFLNVEEVIEKLSALEANVRELTALLTGFIDFVERDKRRLSAREQRILEEEEALERINDAHTAIADEFSARIVAHPLPRIIVHFAEQAWCKVQFFAFLKTGASSEQWHDGLQLLDQLLSAVGRQGAGGGARQDSGKLLAALREKLEAVAFDSYETGRFIDALERYFTGTESDSALLEVISVERLDIALPGTPRQPEPLHEDLPASALESVDTLRKGTWVEFRDTGDGDDAIRCKLVGVIKPTSKYVFTNRKGVKVAEDYRYRMAVKMQQGNLIVLDNSHLFDQAFEQVVADLQGQKGALSPAG